MSPNPYPIFSRRLVLIVPIKVLRLIITIYADFSALPKK